jgi:5-methylcytosine-specific restriction endonuclease McrA
MDQSFRHDEVFPIIAGVISHLAAASKTYVPHGEIVDGLLSASHGSGLLTSALATSKWNTEAQVATNMVAWFSQQITIGNSPWKDYFDRKRVHGVWAYLPATAAPPPLAQDVDLSAVEGNPQLFFHLRRERSRSLRDAKLAALSSSGQTPSCEACGFKSTEVFPGLSGEVLEVHHRLPLGESNGPVATTLADLAVLCPTCHRAVHRTSPMLSVEEFRTKFWQSNGSSAA